MDRPKIRSVEAFPIEHGEQTLVCLRDPMGLAPEPVVLGMGAYFLATLFDGVNTLSDIQAIFAKRFGQTIPLDRLAELVSTLDGACFLESPAFAERERRTREEFLSRPERPAALAGLCYEQDPLKLREEITAYFEPPAGPGLPASGEKDGYLTGLICPHIDPRRGRSVYAHAYGELMARQPPELIVILGTSHHSVGPELFAATAKNYATPLGAVKTDRGFIERLAARYRTGDLFGGELLHRAEHSIEFQAVFLAWALGTSGYQIAPILVGSFHEMVQRGVSPASDPRVACFLDALRAELAAERRRVIVLAAVDFAHVGRKFGDDFGVNEQVARRIERQDMTLIEYVKRGDPDGFFSDIVKDRDQRRICGLAPMYTQLEILRGRPGRLLKYDIAMEPQTGSAVSFASLAIQ